MNNKTVWITLIVFFFIVGAAGSYVLMRYFTSPQNQSLHNEPHIQSAEGQDIMVIRLYVPKNGKLEMIEKKLPRRTKNIAIAEAVIEEFFKTPATGSPFPQGVRILGIYRDASLNLYLDLSDELRRNFQGDALSEYLLLKGMHDSLVANLQDFQDLKILVEGKEIESLGGHFYLKYPLKSTLLGEPRAEGKPAHD
ncbi:MAG: GerMN domain-containing protein [Nitrospirota bacterium]|nr:GerMN domain-containing protein [Nitrospirota bacterium]